jgi:hypothetical protein
LKQLQLIQILRVNWESAVTPRVVAAKVPGVNRTRPRPDAAKPPCCNADAVFALPKTGIAGALRFTAR